MGTTCIEMQGSSWTRIDQHTYNTFPLGILNLAVWYRLFGVSLAVTRLPSVLWSALLLWSVYQILRALAAQRRVAILATLLLAVDYNFAVAATFARLDMMCASLGFCALATYLHFRVSKPALAVLLSCCLVALSLFTHPNGIVFPFALLSLEIVVFKGRIALRTAALGAIPFLIAGSLWLSYVSLDWHAAVEQLSSNSYPGRLTAFLHPLAAIRDEIVGRYLPAYGLTLGEHPSGPVRARGLVLIAYLIAAGAALWVPKIRNAVWAKPILILLAIFSIYFTFFDGTRFTYYVVFFTPFYAVLLAGLLDHVHKIGYQTSTILVVAMLAVLQLGGVAYRSLHSPYRGDFLNAVQFLKSRASGRDLVFADSDFGFSYGFDRNVKEDIRLGYRSGIAPDYIVVGSAMNTNMKGWKERDPAVYQFMLGRLQSYAPIYQSDLYRIYRKPQ